MQNLQYMISDVQDLSVFLCTIPLVNTHELYSHTNF